MCCHFETTSWAPSGVDVPGYACLGSDAGLTAKFFVHVSQGREEAIRSVQRLSHAHPWEHDVAFYGTVVEQVRSVLREARAMHGSRSVLHRWRPERGVGNDHENFNGLHELNCWRSRKAELTRFGKRLAWIEVMEDNGLCVASTWLGC